MKRARSTSPTSGGTNAYESTASPGYNAKFQRIETPAPSSSTNQLIWCSLAPTCSPPNEPSSFHSLEELEKHYAQCHAYVCNAEGCNCVFEREYYLNLHQTELHDPLVQIRKENGEAIYRCLLPDCEVLSQTPNQRRRHLIADHQFDEKFFFSVIKFGIGDQIRAWASLQQQQQPAVQEQEQSSQPAPLQPPQIKPSGHGKKKNRDSMRITSTSIVASGDGLHSASTSISIETPPSTAHSMSIWNAEPKEMNSLAVKFSRTSLLASSLKHGPPVTRTEIQDDYNKKRNTSLVDLKLLTEDRDTSVEDDDEMDDDSPQTGVRFADKVAIRLLSPIDRRYGDGRKGRRRSTGRRGVRPGGVHSDDETNLRSKNFREGRHQGPKGKGRGRRPPSTDKTQQPSN
ncbi:hypothetical protein CPB86DRAFT_729812 [Serendipita vermifera]|nr:hypothetical protein CPB86DRAFT_729812 [Serendipita vermifera]